MSVDDIDIFETHDCFTSSEYAAISAFGLTDPGKEYEAVEDGTVERKINPLVDLSVADILLELLVQGCFLTCTNKLLEPQVDIRFLV